MVETTDPITRVVRAFSKLPGIGEKSGLRLTYFLLKNKPELGRELAASLTEVLDRVRQCSVCHTFTTEEICPLCADSSRDKSTICVVEQVQDMLAIERSHSYHGQFHVLHGAISPLDGIGPESLTIDDLLKRLEGGEVKELIVATNTDTNGETTALYLAEMARSYNVKVTRLASGLPRGGCLEYVDSATLQAALNYRRDL